jgi:ribonuclease HI
MFAKITDTVTIYTDGSASVKEQNGGWAFVARHGKVQATRYGCQDLGKTGSMELTAIVRALLFVAPAPGRLVEIHSDSQYCVNTFSKWARAWRINDWITSTGQRVKNIPLVRDGLLLLEAHERAGGRIALYHCKGHSGIPENELADQLAGEARIKRLHKWDEIADAKFQKHASEDRYNLIDCYAKTANPTIYQR